jgi:hypothetical protein
MIAIYRARPERNFVLLVTARESELRWTPLASDAILGANFGLDP